MAEEREETKSGRLTNEERIVDGWAHIDENTIESEGNEARRTSRGGEILNLDGIETERRNGSLEGVAVDEFSGEDFTELSR